MNVAYLEAGALPRKPARAEGAEPALVRQLCQRIGLVHELRELAAAEERLHHGAYRPGVDQIVGSRIVRLLDRHPLPDDPRHPRQPDGELVGEKLAHRTDPPVSQVVDVVDGPVGLLDHDQVGHNGDEVFLGQRRRIERFVDAEAPVHLVAADLGEIVSLRVEKEPVEQRLRRLDVWRVSRTHQVVYALEGVLTVGCRILLEGLDNDVLVDVSALLYEDDLEDLLRLHQLERRLGQRLARLGDDLARFLADDVLGNDPADQRRILLARTLRERVDLRLVKELDDRAVRRESHRLQKYRHGDLPPPVDVDIHDVVHIDYELDPRASVRNDPRIEQSLAVGMVVVAEDYAGRPVQLADYHSLRAVDDERSPGRDQRDLPEIDIALDDILDHPLAFALFAHDEP